MDKSEKESLLIQKILSIPLKSWAYTDPHQPGDEIPEADYIYTSMGEFKVKYFFSHFGGYYITFESEKKIWGESKKENYTLSLKGNTKMEEKVKKFAIDVRCSLIQKEKEKKAESEIQGERRKQDKEEGLLDNILKSI